MAMKFDSLEQLRNHYKVSVLYADGVGRVAVWNKNTSHWDWWYAGHEKSGWKWTLTGTSEELGDDVSEIRA
jgi:hypothetical protein